MARKTKTVVIPGEPLIGADGQPQQGSRDNGKAFLLTEMSARPAEAWADRAFLTLAHSSIELPEGIERSGMAGVAQIMEVLKDIQLPNASALVDELVASLRVASFTATARLVSRVQFPELAPLMDELLGCVQILPELSDQSRAPIPRAIVNNGREGDDIEEVATRQFLRQEVMGLHLNFLLAAVVLNLIAAASEMREMPSLATMPTFPQPSA